MGRPPGHTTCALHSGTSSSVASAVPQSMWTSSYSRHGRWTDGVTQTHPYEGPPGVRTSSLHPALCSRDLGVSSPQNGCSQSVGSGWTLRPWWERNRSKSSST